MRDRRRLALSFSFSQQSFFLIVAALLIVSGSFAIGSASADADLIDVTFDTSPRMFSVIVDGVIYAPSQQPVSFTWEKGSIHRFGLESNIAYEGYNKRFTFKHWNDFEDSAERVIRLNEDMATTNFVALLKTEYLLTVLSDYGDVQGSGWYEQGSLALISIDDPLIEIEPGKKRLVFNGWLGSSAGHLPNKARNMVEMIGPRLIFADWKEQYKLDILQKDDSSTYATGAGWYDKGTSVRLAADEEITIEGDIHKMKFKEWRVLEPKGGSSNMADKLKPTTMLTLDQYFAVEPVWEEFFYLRINDNSINQNSYPAPNGEGYYKEGETAWLSIEEYKDIASGKERVVFSGWKDDESGQIYTDSAVLTIPVVGEPMSFTPIMKKQYYVEVQSLYGKAKGSGWYDEGTDVLISVDHTDIELGLGKSAVFEGWSSADLMLSDGRMNIIPTSKYILQSLDQPVKIQAIWKIDDFTRFMIVGLVVIAIAATIGFMILKRRMEAKEQPYGRGRRRAMDDYMST